MSLLPGDEPLVFQRHFLEPNISDLANTVQSAANMATDVLDDAGLLAELEKEGKEYDKVCDTLSSQNEQAD